ncbi:hypothetical protein [Limosilactobacillus caccae]|uniref:hypothetical protein n=1 Tax=Limosilactobacillus caccae TaxID=1926284 RepID=UPI00117B00AC|nr:hypothetical protein [Limosilactobacillus caccae]
MLEKNFSLHMRKKKIKNEFNNFLFNYKWDQGFMGGLIDYYEDILKPSSDELLTENKYIFNNYKVYLSLKEDFSKLSLNELLDIKAYLDIEITKKNNIKYTEVLETVISSLKYSLPWLFLCFGMAYPNKDNTKIVLNYHLILGWVSNPILIIFIFYVLLLLAIVIIALITSHKKSKNSIDVFTAIINRAIDDKKYITNHYPHVLK